MGERPRLSRQLQQDQGTTHGRTGIPAPASSSCLPGPHLSSAASALRLATSSCLAATTCTEHGNMTIQATVPSMYKQDQWRLERPCAGSPRACPCGPLHPHPPLSGLLHPTALATHLCGQLVQSTLRGCIGQNLQVAGTGQCKLHCLATINARCRWQMPQPATMLSLGLHECFVQSPCS